MAIQHIISHQFSAVLEATKNFTGLLSMSSSLATTSAVVDISGGLSVLCCFLDPAKALFEAETKAEISGRVDISMRSTAAFIQHLINKLLLQEAGCDNRPHFQA